MSGQDYKLPAWQPQGVSEKRQYLTAAQVADLLQVSSRTVERWARQDASLPVTKLGRLLRFERGALAAWLARSTQGARKGRASVAKPATSIGKPTDTLSVETLTR